MPVEMMREIAYHGGACSLFAFILLVRTASACREWHSAIFDVRTRLVAHFNKRLLLSPAYFYGTYGSDGHRWSVGVEDVNHVEHPINNDQKLTFEVRAVDDITMRKSLRILVVLKVHIMLAAVVGRGSTLELSLALNFFDPVSSFSLCAAIGWPTGILQADHVQSEDLPRDVFNRCNLPQTLSINWVHPISKLSVRAPSYKDHDNDEEYSASLKNNNSLIVQVMRAFRNVTDPSDPSDFVRRKFDPMRHLWLQITNLNHPDMYCNFKRRGLHLDGTLIDTTPLMIACGHVSIEDILQLHFDTYFTRTSSSLPARVFEQLTFHTNGELNNEASGLHLMNTFGYLEHSRAHCIAEAETAAQMKADMEELFEEMEAVEDEEGEKEGGD